MSDAAPHVDSPHSNGRRVPPLSPDQRARLKSFADEHVKTPAFQKKLDEVRRRIQNESAN